MNKFVKTTIPLFFVLILSISTVFAQGKVDSLKNLLKGSPDREKIGILIKIGYYLSSQNPSGAIRYLNEAILLSDKTGSKWNKADALFNKGVALWHLGDIGESGAFYSEAKKIYEEFKDTLSIIKVLNSEAINNSMEGRIDLALEKFFKSLEYATKINDRPTIFNTLFNIGIIFDNKGDLDKALSNYTEALKYADENRSLALVQNYIAEVYLTLKNYGKAEEYLNLAIVNAGTSDDNNNLVWAYTNLGNMNVSKKSFAEAEENFLSALDLARKSDYKLEIIHSLTQLGNFYARTKKYSVAEAYFLEAYNISLSLNSLKELSITSGNLSDTYSNLGNFSQAYKYLKLNKHYSDSLITISNNEKVSELEARYAVRQREKETELLKNENSLQKKIIETQTHIAVIISVLGFILVLLLWTLVRNRRKILAAQNDLQLKNEEIERKQEEITEKNRKLQVLNSTKDKFFSIVAHDLRNPIAAFVSISDLLESDYDSMSNTEKKSLLAHMNNSSKNLIRLLENLLTWARLSNDKLDIFYQNSGIRDLVEASVSPYLHWAGNKNIKIIFNYPGNEPIKTDPFIFQTVVGNLINNAIKFTSAGGNVIISLRSVDSKYILSIKDDGIGIEEDRLKDLFELNNRKTTRGTMSESGTGLGLVLVKDLVRKMDWQIEVNSISNQGSEFILHLPINN